MFLLPEKLCFPITVCAIFIVSSSAFGEKVPAKIVFNRDIRPILSDNCFACHGPDEKKREADLRLDTKEGAFAKLDDHFTIMAGDSKSSTLFQRIITHDADEKMPPAESRKKLTAHQVKLIQLWIEQGAKWQDHWSFVNPTKPKLPVIKNKNWAKQPIDAFILNRLESEKLSPSPQVNKKTLLRRVTLDLIGLPPTPKEVAAFEKDHSPDAYEKVVDRLLKSKEYGEHMSRFWLDAARYSDTNGLHLDNYREIWPYRDWVINSFNTNMPFDQFTVKQLAGDLLPNATLEDQIATGFNRCHVTTNEGGSIPEEIYVRNNVDRVSTTGTVFMGLTLGCAVCHEHKFDPVTQTEFYQMFAYFNNIAGSPMDGNLKNQPPYAYVPTSKEKKKWDGIRQQIASVKLKQKKRTQATQAAFNAWLKWQNQVVKSSRKSSLDSHLPSGLSAYFPLDGKIGLKAANVANPKLGGAVIDGKKGKAAWVAGKKGKALMIIKGAKTYLKLNPQIGLYKEKINHPFSFGVWVYVPHSRKESIIVARRMTSQKLDERNYGYDLSVYKGRLSFEMNGYPNTGIKIVTSNKVVANRKWHHFFVTYDGSGRANGVNLYVNGIRQEKDILKDAPSRRARFFVNTPLTLGSRAGKKVLIGAKFDEFMFYDRKLSDREIAYVALVDDVRASLTKDVKKRTANEKKILNDFYTSQFDAPYYKMTQQIEKLNQQEKKLKTKMTTTLVYKERKKIKQAYFLNRGEYDKKGKKVVRNTPAQLPPMAKGLPQNRLGLAKWLVSNQHPLTSRVTVNRFWQQVFGIGIVETAEDFGSQGTPPSHPQLLDWLAVDFRENGWNVKRLMKQMVMSATYQQSSKITAESFKRDPKNRLLARGSRYRLDAETLRDQALAVSGLLVKKIGGRSVKPPQPGGLWKAVGYSGSNTVKFVQDKGANKVYRRTLYTFLKRTSAPPEMSTFDAPSREECRVRRERTNSPLQALLLMNDPQYFEAARFLGQRMIKEAGKTNAEKIIFAFQLTTTRKPTTKEIALLTVSLNDHLTEFKANPDAAKKVIAIGETPPDKKLDVPQLAAWTMVANLILNLDEVITKE